METGKCPAPVSEIKRGLGQRRASSGILGGERHCIPPLMNAAAQLAVCTSGAFRSSRPLRRIVGSPTSYPGRIYGEAGGLQKLGARRKHPQKRKTAPRHKEGRPVFVGVMSRAPLRRENRVKEERGPARAAAHPDDYADFAAAQDGPSRVRSLGRFPKRRRRARYACSMCNKEAGDGVLVEP